MLMCSVLFHLHLQNFAVMAPDRVKNSSFICQIVWKYVTLSYILIAN